MYEFEILLKTGERVFIWGYSYQDALYKSSISANEVEALLFRERIE